jgi:hypothetical protein
MAYKVNIRGIEVFADTLEDLKKLIREFGKDSAGKKVQEQSGFAEIPVSETEEIQLGGSMDKALLQRFIEADKKGINSVQLQLRLGANKKTLKKALEEWAKRLNLWQNKLDAIFEYGIFTGTNRGFRLTKEAIGVGKDIVGMK